MVPLYTFGDIGTSEIMLILIISLSIVASHELGKVIAFFKERYGKEKKNKGAS